MSNKILSVFFMTFLAYWLFIISSVRIFDITLDDKLSLLGKMPIYYTFALFALASLSMLCFYLRKSFWSVAFAGLFVLYFWITPWFIEPLRVIDTLAHFARVPVVMDKGYVPQIQGYYFGYPGSTLWGTMFLSVTGMNSLTFIKYFFPLFSTAILYFGFFCLVRKITGNSLSAGPSLLLLSLFGYGAYHFSPIGFAWMIIPLLLFSVMQSGERARAFFVCFILLSFTLTVSHPTTSAFLLLVFPMLVLLSYVWNKRFHVAATTMQLIKSRSLIFVCLVLAWSSFVALMLFRNVRVFVLSLAETTFSRSSEIPQMLMQRPFAIQEISLGRRMYVVLAGVFAVAVLFRILYVFIKGKGPKHLYNYKVWVLVPISATFMGMLLFPFFLISVPIFGLYYSFAFGLFGAAMGFKLLESRSLKFFCILFSLVLLLIVPSFFDAYPVEQFNVLRDPIRYGMQFTGGHVIVRQDTKIVSPFVAQLWSFVNVDQWNSLVNILSSGVGAPVFNKSILISQVEQSDYFIFRSDAVYLASLQIERVPPKETQYFQISTALSNNTSFDLVYSSQEYLMFTKQRG